MLDICRRTIVALLALALLLGPGAGAYSHAAGGGKSTMAMSGDMQSSGKCNDCDGGKAGLPVAACNMSCVGIVGLSESPAVLAIPTPAVFVGSRTTFVLTGQDVSPNPYPPRTDILS